MLQVIIKRSSTTTSSSSNYKSEFPNFAQNNFWFFDLIFTIICFPTLSKKFFLKKIEKCKCYKPSSSDHQQQHHHPLVEPMHKSPIFEGALSRTFTILSGLVENLLGSPQKILAPSAPPRNTKKRHVFQILDIF